jgi:pimeloyl-ACP methyl ester carboxylesterase
VSETVSSDGTKIAFDRTGDGPPVILVVGAFNDRATGAPLARALEGRLSVLNYDRRGRGASGDTQPYAVEREVEDLNALIQEAGGEASVFGYSSGANLALEAAIRGLKITKLAMYEPAFVDDTVPDLPKDIATQLEKLVTTGRRGAFPNTTGRNAGIVSGRDEKRSFSAGPRSDRAHARVRREGGRGSEGAGCTCAQCDDAHAHRLRSCRPDILDQRG